jgi:hypothetical protein
MGSSTGARHGRDRARRWTRLQLDNSKSCEGAVTRLVTVTQVSPCVHAFIMSDVYDIRPGGSLKLKGVAEGGVTKKYVFYGFV